MLLFSSQIYLKAIFLLQEVFYTVHNPIEMKQNPGVEIRENFLARHKFSKLLNSVSL